VQLHTKVSGGCQHDCRLKKMGSTSAHPQSRIGQVFSSWAGGLDDPLRLVVDGGKLFARVEAGGGFSTTGVLVETGRWYAVAATKRGRTLTLYLDGRAIGSCSVPEFTNTRARDRALGGNPHFAGKEFLAARDLRSSASMPERFRTKKFGSLPLHVKEALSMNLPWIGVGTRD
jgi:hypothetical protein